MPTSKRRKIDPTRPRRQPRADWIGINTNKPAVPDNAHVIADLTLGLDVPADELGPRAAGSFVANLRVGMYGAVLLWSIGDDGAAALPKEADDHAEALAGGKCLLRILTEPNRMDDWLAVIPPGVPLVTSATWVN